MNARGLRRRTVALLLTLSVASSHVVVAYAQTDEERAAARAAATEGAKAFGDKRWADAVDLFLKAESLMHAPPHLLYLARSYEKLGKLVKAQETYAKITHENIAADKPKAFHDAKENAIKELSALEPRVPTLKTLVEGGAPGKPIKVLVDGVEINAAFLGLSRPVDPGEHKLEASSEGLVAEPVTITLKEGAHETATLTLKAAGAVVGTGTGSGTGTGTGTGTGAEAGTGAGTGSGTGTGTGTPPDVAPSGGSGSGKWLGIGLIGVGVVGLGVGTVFLLKASSKSKEADDACGGAPPCPASTRDQVSSLDDESKSAKTIGLISLTVGGLAAVGGVVLLLTSGSSSPSSTTTASIKSKPTVTPWVGVGSVGLSGSF